MYKRQHFYFEEYEDDATSFNKRRDGGEFLLESNQVVNKFNVLTKQRTEATKAIESKLSKTSPEAMLALVERRNGCSSAAAAETSPPPNLKEEEAEQDDASADKDADEDESSDDLSRAPNLSLHQQLKASSLQTSAKSKTSGKTAITGGGLPTSRKTANPSGGLPTSRASGGAGDAPSAKWPALAKMAGDAPSVVRNLSDDGRVARLWKSLQDDIATLTT